MAYLSRVDKNVILKLNNTNMETNNIDVMENGLKVVMAPSMRSLEEVSMDNQTAPVSGLVKMNREIAEKLAGKKLKTAADKQIVKLLEIFDQADGMPIKLKYGEAQKLINTIIELFGKTPELAWSKIYNDYFNLDVDFSNIIIPSFYDPNKHFAIIVAKCLTPNRIVTAMHQFFDVYINCSEDLNGEFSVNDRVADDNYVVIFNRVDFEENLRNLSAKELTEKNIKGITLIERMLLEIMYYSQTGKHLDVGDEVGTLCSGSRNSRGLVPCIHWLPGRAGLQIECISASAKGVSGGKLCGREVVSDI